MPSPAIGGDASSSATGITRPAYRRAINGVIGHERTVSATTDTAEPRMLTISMLRADGAPSGRLDGHWVYDPDQDEAHQILNGSYDGVTATAMLDDPFTTDLAGATVEITNTLPGTYHHDLKGTNQIVNEALARVNVWARISLTGDGTRTFDLSAYSGWLTSEDYIEGIEDTVGLASTDPTDVAYSGFRVQQNGIGLTLVTDYAYGADQTVTLLAIRQGDKWIRNNGTWGAGDGLTSETQEAAAPLHWIRELGAVLAFRYLIEVVEEDETLSEERRARRIARYRSRIKGHASTVRRIIRDELPKRTPRAPMSAVGGIATGQTVTSGVLTGWP